MQHPHATDRQPRRARFGHSGSVDFGHGPQRGGSASPHPSPRTVERRGDVAPRVAFTQVRQRPPETQGDSRAGGSSGGVEGGVPQADRYPGRCSSRRWRSAARPRRRRAAGSRHEHRRRRHTNLPDRAGGSGSGDPSTAPVLGRPRRTKRVRARRRPTHSAQPHCGSVVVQRSPGSATRATARVHAPLPHSTLIGNARMVAPIAGTAVRLASFSICR
jgi:hypothetical protein